MQRNGFLIARNHLTVPNLSSDTLENTPTGLLSATTVSKVYTVAAMLGGQDDIGVVKIKDYIQKPKENGYRSFHMIVEVPVFFSNEKNDVRVEVQLRTIAMDFWATLEHGIKYKKEIADSAAIVAELKDCAEQVYALDTRMQSLRDRIRGAK